MLEAIISFLLHGLNAVNFIVMECVLVTLSEFVISLFICWLSQTVELC